MKIKTANDFEESLAVFLSGIGLSRIDERCAASYTVYLEGIVSIRCVVLPTMLRKKNRGQGLYLGRVC